MSIVSSGQITITDLLDGKNGANGKDGVAGKDGIGIKTTVITYAISTSGTTAPNTSWTSQVPTLVKGQYLWTKTVWTYTDNSSETGYSVTYISKDGNNGNDGIAGKDGTGIKKTTITYAVGTSGTTAPSSGWNSQVPNVPEGQFLWTKTVWDYTDNTSETGYSVSKFGEKGDKGDRGIQGLQGPDGTQGIPGPKGVDGTDAPTITVKSYTYSAGSRAEIELTGPNAFKQTVYNRGHNIWVIDATTHELKEFVSCDTYSTMSFSHNGVSTSLADYLTSLEDSIVVIAASDADSIDQNVRDVLNYMGGFPDLGTWGSWRYGHVFIGMSKRNDGTWPLQPRQGYEEAINKDGSAPEIGCTLSKGGIVANGADGKTQYTHIAYANSADGWKDFSTSNSNRAYIGMYVDFNSNDSTTPSDYSWTLVKGADGTQGIPGTPGKDGKIPFFHTAWSYSADGKNGFTTSYPNLNLLEGTAQFTGDWGRWRWHGTWDADPYNGHKAVQTNNAWGGPKYVINDLFNRKVVSPNTDYTLSVKIKNTSNASMDIYFFADITLLGENNKQNKQIIKLPPNSDWTTISTTFQFSDVNPNSDYGTMRFEPGSDTPWQQGTIIQSEMKFEPGSIATPYIQSANEVKTSDYPIYIGQYTNDKKDDSTNPSDYTWSLIRGNDGKDGAPGKDGRAGNDGNPGKVVSDTEPTTKFKGLTWKYVGITAIDASDGTNIQPNTEYYWNGKNWVIYLINAQNIDVQKLTALTANLGDATAGSLTVEKGATGGIAVKDGLVKSWDVSKIEDYNYPGGYSYTSMGVALNSGGLTIYSAGYGITLDKGKVIDPKYEVASLQAIASNGRNNGGTGLLLNATDSDFPFTINGNVDVIGSIRQTTKTTTVDIGAGLTLRLDRRGETVIAILEGEINASLYPGQPFIMGQIPLGYQPNRIVYIPLHMAGTLNSAHIDVGPDGGCTWWGASTDNGDPRGTQMWFTDDPLPI